MDISHHPVPLSESILRNATQISNLWAVQFWTIPMARTTICRLSFWMQISEIHKYVIRTPRLQLPIIGLPQIVVPPQIITTVATLNNHNHDNQNATKHQYRFKSGIRALCAVEQGCVLPVKAKAKTGTATATSYALHATAICIAKNVTAEKATTPQNTGNQSVNSTILPLPPHIKHLGQWENIIF